MKLNKLLLLLCLPLCLSCVERYYPEENNTSTNLVVNASLTNTSSVQTIKLSRSEDLFEPRHIVESGYAVSIENELGEFLNFIEDMPGEYNATPPVNYFNPDHEYKLTLVSNKGEIYESEFVKIEKGAEIDSVYYELDYNYINDLYNPVPGIQFYTNFNILNQNQYFRWEIIETYEFRNPNLEAFIYGYDRQVKPLPDSLSDRQCWITKKYPDIITQSTIGIDGNIYQHFPLHFVSNETQRLKYHYSILIRQLSLTKEAYEYWDMLKQNSSSNNSIITQQPGITPGNICNIDNEQERIIGYFNIAGNSEKRIFVKQVEGLEFPDKIFCFPGFEAPILRYTPSNELPKYLARAIWPEDGETYFGEVEQHCLDCRIMEGSQGEPPGFWID